MILALVLTVLGVVIILDAVVWGALIARWLGIPAVRLTAHPGRHVTVQPVTLPVTEQVIAITQTPDRPPWMITTAAQPALAITAGAK